MKQDWHGYGRKLQAAEQALRNSTISERNKDLILAFKRQLVIEGITNARILAYFSRLPHMARVLNKDFDQCAKEDIERLVEHIEQQPHSEWTKHGGKAMIKRFYRWLRNTGDEYPPEVRWLKTAVRADRLPLPGQGDLVTPSEVGSMSELANHPRDKALLSMLYESGGRIGEIGTLKIRDVSFEKVGCRVTVLGKTGSRPILIVNSAHFLATWLSIHPRKHDREAPLWVNIGGTNHGQQMTYPAIAKMLRVLFKRAGIKKKAKPHNFRHASASHLAPHLTEAMMNHRFGWVQGSRMPAIYVHLSGKDTDAAILKLHGMAGDEQLGLQLQAKRCPRCDHVNPHEFAFCGKCGAALDLKAALQHEAQRQELVAKRDATDAALNSLLQDAEVREFLKKKLTLLDA
jgi:integrase/recombinase XerD